MKIFWGIVGGIVALVMLGTVFGSFYTVDQGYRYVVLTNGRVTGVDGPGLQFKTPWVQDVVPMEVRTRKLTKDKMNTYSKDNQAAMLRVSINYSLDPGRVDAVYARYGKEYETRVIDPRVFKYVKDIFGKYGAGDVVANRDKLASEITAMLTEDLRDDGIIIETTQVEDIDFDDTYEKGIRDAMAKEAEVRREKYAAEVNRVQTDQRAYQTRTDADANAYKTRTQAEAEAFHIEARGKAEAAAIAQRADALRKNQDLIALIAAEKWDGKLPATMVPGSAVPFIGIK